MTSGGTPPDARYTLIQGGDFRCISPIVVMAFVPYVTQMPPPPPPLDSPAITLEDMLRRQMSEFGDLRAQARPLLKDSRRSFKRWTWIGAAGILAAAGSQAGVWTAATEEQRRLWLIFTFTGIIALAVALYYNTATLITVRSWGSTAFAARFGYTPGPLLDRYDAGRRHDYLTDTGQPITDWPDRWLLPPWRNPRKTHAGPPADWQVQPRPEIHAPNPNRN